MKKILLPLLLLTGFIGFGQSVGRLRYDTTIIEKVGGSNELIIRNKTRDTLGYLFNAGGGRVIFKTIPASSGGSVTLIDSLRMDSLLKRYTISTEGDSFTAGFTQLVGGYPEALSYLSGRIILNNGIGGATSQVILADFIAHPERWNYSTIIWSGYNNRDQATTIIANCKAMADSLIAHTNNRFLFLTIPNGPADSAVGSTHYTWYDSIKKVQTSLEALYPGHVADVRAMLVAHYNPALPNDVLAHSQDQIPPSLRTEAYPNGVHLTTAGYQLVAGYLDTAYGGIIYNRQFKDTAIGANQAVHLLTGEMPDINIKNEGSYRIGNVQMLYRPNRYNAPDNYIASDGGRSITTAAKNTTVGSGAGLSLTSAAENVLIGYKAGQLIAATNNNVAIGSSAMTNTAAAFDNVMVGYQTGLGTGAFGRNTGIGSTALRSIDAGTDNTGVGQGALSGVQSGVNNTVMGRAAASNGLVQNRLSIFGANACTQCAVGDNSSIGYQSLFQMTNGANNTALGEYSQYSNLLGNWNTSGGQYSQWGTNSGTASHYQNTSFGAYSLYQVRNAANRNIAIGYKAIIDSITGSDNIAIGDSLDLPSRTGSDQGTIGNVVYIIGGMGHGTTVGPGRVGIGVNAPAASAKLDVTSTTQGFLMPRMTQTQRDAISSPATGLMIYDITNAGYYWYNGSAWVPVASGGGSGTDNTNAGSFYRLVIPSSQAIKTIAPGLDLLADSTTNTNAITIKVDTTTMFPQIRGTLPPAGGLTIGAAISGGAAYSTLFEGSGNTLSELTGYKFDGVKRQYIPDAGSYRIGTNVGLYIPNQTSFPNSMFAGDSIINMASGASLNATFGTNAGKSITTAVSNAFFGPRAGQATTSATNSVAVGDAALFGQTNTATNNTAVGKSAMQGTTTASNNTAVGASALLNNVTGAQNVAIGTTALNSNTASDNTAIGFQAGYQNASGINNTSVGSGAMTGVGGNNFSNNTAVGYKAMNAITTGSGNIAIGDSAARSLTTSIRAITIGTNLTDNGSFSLNLGGAIFGTGLTATGTSTAGNIGVGITTPREVLDVNGILSLRNVPATTDVDSLMTLTAGRANAIDATAWGRTASTGLTNTVGTWTANLSTGVSGGQTLRGGTASNDQLLVRGSIVASGSTVTNPDITFTVGDGSGLTALQLLKNSKTVFSGAVAMPINTITTTTTLDATYYTVLVDASGGAVTVNLPAVAGTTITKTIYIIKKIDASVNAVTIDGNASETIDGATTKALNTQNAGVTIQTNGSAWYIIGTF